MIYYEYLKFLQYIIYNVNFPLKNPEMFHNINIYHFWFHIDYYLKLVILLNRGILGHSLNHRR